MNKPRRTHKPKLSNNNNAFVPRVVAAAISPIQAKKPIKTTQDEDDDDDMLAPTTLDLPTDDWDDGEDEEAAQPQPRRSPRLNRMNVMCQSLASVSQQALHTFTANAILQELHWTMETKVDPLNMEQVANDVVHPVTQETITKYKKLIDDPLLRETWMKAMTKELGRLA